MSTKPDDRERRLATIMCADIVGYSHLMDVDEEGTYTALHVARSEVIEPGIAKHKGRIVKHTGDGFLAEFPTVLSALKFAMGMQKEMGRRVKDVPENLRIKFRIGINLGDIIVDEDGDIFGDGVNIAARLETLGIPGGICISGSVYEAVHKKLKVKFEDLGKQKVKNISDKVQAYDVRWPGEDSTPDERTLKPTAKPKSLGLIAGGVMATITIIGLILWQLYLSEPEVDEARAAVVSVAVLPFVNMSNDPDQEYFSDGISEEILNSLVKLKGLEVAGRTSSFVFKGQSQDLRTIGEALGVTHLIEGSVRKAGVRIRITAQLVRADNGFHLWSETYDRELTDIFAIQDEIAASIAKALKVKLLGNTETTATEAVNVEAYDYYLKGLQGMRVNTFEVLKAAEENFAAARRIDPGFAAAYARQALAIWDQVNTGALPLSALDQVEEVALEALAIEPDLSAAHVALALAANNKNDEEKAVRHALRALALGEANAEYMANLASVLSGAGDFERANRLFQQALRLDPLNSLVHMRYAIVSNRKWGLIDQGQRGFERTIELQPDNPNGWILLGLLLADKQGDVAAALPLILKSETLDPRDPDLANSITFAYLALGDGEEAERWADRTMKIGPDTGIAAVTKIHQLIFAGREDVALDLGRETLAREDILHRQFSKSMLVASLAGIYMRRGDWSTAEEIVLSAYPRITEFPNNPTASAFEVRNGSEFSIMMNRILAEIFAQSGQAEKAAILNAHMDFITAEIMLEGERQALVPRDYWFLAAIKAGRGDPEEALDDLEKAAAGFRLNWQYFFRDHPALWPLHDHPRYKALLASLEAEMARQRAVFEAGQAEAAESGS